MPNPDDYPDPDGYEWDENDLGLAALLFGALLGFAFGAGLVGLIWWLT